MDRKTAGNGRFSSLKAKMMLSFGILVASMVILDMVVEFYGIPFTPIRGEFQIQQEEVLESLNMIADLKKERLARWLEERGDDAEVLTNNDFLRSSLSYLTEFIRDEQGRGLPEDELWKKVRGERAHKDIVQFLNSFISTHLVYESIRIIEPESGTIMVSTDFADLGLNYFEVDNYPAILDTDERGSGIGYHIHADRFHIEISRPIKVAGAPVDREGTTVGLMNVHVESEDIMEPLLQTSGLLDKTGEVTLVNQDAVLMTSLKYPLADGTVAEPFTFKMKAKPAVLAASGSEGIIAIDDYRGIPVLVAYRHIPLSPRLAWGMVVKKDRAEVFAPLNQAILIHLLKGTAFLIVVLLLTFYIAGNLSRPIDSLSKTAVKVEAGDFTARVSGGGSGEVGDLVRTFNTMVHRIQNWYQVLEEQIKSRTFELEESEKKYRNLVDHSLTGVFSSTTGGELRYANEALAKILEFDSPSEILGKNVIERYSAPGDREKFIGTLREKGEVDNYELDVRTKTGKTKKILINAILDKEVISGMVLDISDRYQMMKKLQESEKRFRDLVESSLSGIVIVQDDKIVYKNPELEQMIGKVPESFHPEKFAGIHPIDQEKFRQLHRRISSGESHTEETEFRLFPENLKTGKRRSVKWVFCRANPIEFREKGALLINLTDITRAKERDLVLRDKMASLGRVATGIAHEIRNPLSGINIYLDTLNKIIEGCEKHDMAQEIIQQIQSASSKIESVVRKTMDFAKPGVASFVQTDINKPIKAAVNLSITALRRNEIVIEDALAPGLPTCYAVPRQLEQVILNLIANSAKAMEKRGGPRKITISSSAGNNRITVRVSDSGPGVPAELKERIFEPFFTTSSDSTGLGLSICNRIVEDHGGKMEVLDRDGGGAEFVIEIPVERRRIPR